MYIEIDKGALERASVTVRNERNDYSLLDKDGVLAFVYGYPFDDSKAKWFLASDVYRAYILNALDFANSIDGVYSIVIIDRIKRKCFVISDRYGIYSMFYAQGGNRFVISDEIGQIVSLTGNAELNRESIIEYLYIGLKIGIKTHIKNIYQFEPSTIYQIYGDFRTEQKRYWNFQGISQEQRFTKQQFCQAFNAHIANAIQLEQKASLPLTGGLDTRTILSACLTQKDKLHCYTHGIKGARDVELARQICKHFGIDYSCYELDEKWIEDIPSMLRKKAAIMNGLIPSLMTLHAESSYEKEQEKAGMLISGSLGNEIWRGRYIFMANSKTKDEFALGLANRFRGNNSPYSLEVYNGLSADNVTMMIRDSILTELSCRQGAETALDWMDTLVFRTLGWNWAGNSLKAIGRHFKIFAGLLQKDILPQIPLMSLKDRDQRTIQRYIVCANSSYLAKLPLDKGGFVRQSLPGRIYGIFSDLPENINMACLRLTGKKLFGIKRTFHDYPAWLRTHHRNFVLEELEYKNMVTQELFEKEKLKTVIDSFFAGDLRNAPFIIRLISLETWLKDIGLKS